MPREVRQMVLRRPSWVAAATTSKFSRRDVSLAIPHNGRAAKKGMRLTGNKCANNKAPINHGVGEENEPAVAGALLELAARLGAANTSSRIFAYMSSSIISIL